MLRVINEPAIQEQFLNFEAKSVKQNVFEYVEKKAKTVSNKQEKGIEGICDWISD